MEPYPRKRDLQGMFCRRMASCQVKFLHLHLENRIGEMIKTLEFHLI